MVTITVAYEMIDVDLEVTETEVTVEVFAHGEQGKSAYQSYLDTTEDDPVLSEEEWSASELNRVGTTGFTAGRMLRIASGGGIEERTPAQVLSDIGVTSVGAAVATAATTRSARAAISAGFRPALIRTIAFLGDSITNQCYSYTDPATSTENDGGFVAWTATLSRRRFTVAKMGPGNHVFGFSGQRADQILPWARMAAMAGDAVFVLAGANDAAQGATAATIRDRIAALWQAVIDNGATPIGATITPSANATYQATIDAANALIAAKASEMGVPLCVWPASLMSAGVANVALFPDGTHPNALAAAIMGATLADTLDDLLQPDDFPILPASDGRWITPNPYVTGSSGGLATSWTSIPAASITITPTKVGEWQQLAVTGAGTGISIVYAQNTTVGTGWNVGDTVRGIAEIEAVSSGFSFKNINIFARFHTHGGGGISHSASSGEVAAMGTPNSPFGGILLTPEVVVPATATRIQIYLQFYGTGTFRFRKSGVFRV